jgi:hypothetical protein
VRCAPHVRRIRGCPHSVSAKRSRTTAGRDRCQKRSHFARIALTSVADQDATCTEPSGRKILDSTTEDHLAADEYLVGVRRHAGV